MLVNKSLLEELKLLASDSLIILKELELLNVNSLNTLPIDEDFIGRSDIYKNLFDAVKEKLNSDEELVPTSCDNFASHKNVMLLRSIALEKLINKDQRKGLFKREYWADTSITQNRNEKLWKYFKSHLKIQEIDISSFISNIDDLFLIAQEDVWMINFYVFLNENVQNLYQIKGKKIIRIFENGRNQQVEPFDDKGIPNVFLPTENTTRFRTVKNDIAKSEAILYLKKIGLTPPDLNAEIHEFIISKLREGKIYPEYLSDFKKILKYFDVTIINENDLIFRGLRNTKCVLSVIDDNLTLCKPEELYIPTEDLKNYFEGNGEVKFVNLAAYKDVGIDCKMLKDCLKELGVADYPRRKSIEGKKTDVEKKELRKNSRIQNVSRNTEKIEDYNLDGLDFFFKNISLSRSIALWNMLHSIDESNFFKGKYTWSYMNSGQQIALFKAKFYESLNNEEWLYNNSNNLVSPQEITNGELSDDYESPDETKFKLSFKSNWIQEIEEKQNSKFVPNEEYERLKQIEEEYNKLINSNESNEEDDNEDDNDFFDDNDLNDELNDNENSNHDKPKTALGKSSSSNNNGSKESPYQKVFRMPNAVKILGRKSSITNSFTNGITPIIRPSDEDIKKLLDLFGMDVNNVSCVYCGDKHTEWDHFRPLIKDREFTGYISEIQNLVPACSKCNQSKGNRDWNEWIDSDAKQSPKTRDVANLEEIKNKLIEFSRWQDPTKLDYQEIVGEPRWSDYNQSLIDIIISMEKAQEISNEIKKLVNDSLNK